MGYVWRLTKYALKHWGHFIGYLACAGIGSLFNVLTPLVLVSIIDDVLPSGQYELILPYVLIYITLSGLYAVFDIAGRYGAALTAQNVIYDLRSELYDSLLEKDLAFYDENETGKLLARVTTDVTTMRHFLYWGYRVVFIAIATLIGTYAVMFTLSIQLTLYMLLALPFIVAFIYLFAKRVRPVFYEARSQYGTLSSVLSENVTGMKVVKAYTATEREYNRVQDENEKFYETRTEALRLLSLYRPLLPAVLGFITGILIYYGGISFTLGVISYGRFVGFISLVSMLYLPARFLSWGVGMYQRASASGERTFYILDHEDELTEPEEPVRVEDLDGRVEFDGVDFSYGGDNWILRDINLSVEPGQTVALLGGTGSGKTSLVNLIPRFYDVDTRSTVTYDCKKYPVDEKGNVEIEGETYTVEGDTVEIEGEEYPVKLPGAVRVDGIDVRLYSLEDLRSNIGMVHQDPFLFSASVRDNIAFGNPQAPLKEVKEAAKAANIHDYIITTENGYDARIGERGVTLSGGQKQRIAIARALLANPRILILDDSTSSVDARTEMLIQEALEKLMTGRTTFIITHRLSTIRNADMIVMMDRGRIVEKGTHKELLEKDGLYAGLHATLKQMEIAAPQAQSPQTSTKEMEVSSDG